MPDRTAGSDWVIAHFIQPNGYDDDGLGDDDDGNGHDYNDERDGRYLIDDHVRDGDENGHDVTVYKDAGDEEAEVMMVIMMSVMALAIMTRMMAMTL